MLRQRHPKAGVQVQGSGSAGPTVGAMLLTKDVSREQQRVAAGLARLYLVVPTKTGEQRTIGQAVVGPMGFREPQPWRTVNRNANIRPASL